MLLSIAQEAKDGATSGHAAAKEGQRRSSEVGGGENTAGARGAGELTPGKAAGKRQLRRPRHSCSFARSRCPSPSLFRSPSPAAPSSPGPPVTPTPSLTVPRGASRCSALTGSDWADTFHSAQIPKPPGPQDLSGGGGGGRKGGGKRSGKGGGGGLSRHLPSS